MKFAPRTVACSVICFMAAIPCAAATHVRHLSIEETSVNMRGADVVLGQQSIAVTESGNVLVQFDGTCVSYAGDRIVFSASNTPNWSIDDGHTAVEAYDNDVKHHSFSHTRLYPVAAGTHTYYAVGRNIVEMDGPGIASVYGNLTIKFFPHEVNGPFVSHQGVVELNRNTRGSPQVISQMDLVIPVPGDVLVRFDGMCVSDPGDLIVIAASNVVGWADNDGSTGTQAIDSDLNSRVFSHSRKYTVDPGLNSFFAVAQNSVETEGNGRASFYGSLTVEFFPATQNQEFLLHMGVSQTDIDVESAEVTMGELSLTTPQAGVAVVRYEGLCVSSPGDRVIMAASHSPNWGSNSGNVAVMAVSTDLPYNNFSHTRVYDLVAGDHTFFAVCQNIVETEGNGIASNYASFSVEFFPDLSATGVAEGGVPRSAALLEPNYPNPFNPATTIAYELNRTGNVNLSIYNLLGQHIRTLVDERQNAGRWVQRWDGKNDHDEVVSSGVYLYRLITDGHREMRKMMLMK